VSFFYGFADSNIQRATPTLLNKGTKMNELLDQLVMLFMGMAIFIVSGTFAVISKYIWDAIHRLERNAVLNNLAVRQLTLEMFIKEAANSDETLTFEQRLQQDKEREDYVADLKIALKDWDAQHGTD
jgi:hypothetical protein